MKIYVGAKFQQKEKALEIVRRLKEMGHEISCDWTTHKSVKPYEENQELSEEYSKEDINGVIESDVFILVVDERFGSGMSVELGAAISSSVKTGKPKIYVVGNYEQNMFSFHPSVIRESSIEEVFGKLKI